MSRNNLQLYYHLVFVTKYRERLIHEEIENMLYAFLWNKVEALNEQPLMINGMPDHVHLLLKMTATQNISKLVKDLKGSTSRFMNNAMENQGQSFEWSRGYGAFTVSKKDVDMIANYIKNQKSHHQKGTIDVALEDVS
jgi:REP element-mobilizing transposase RayT